MIRLALIGYGHNASKHIEVFRELGCTFVAACNRSEDGRRKAEVEGGIPRTYARIDEMLEGECPDGIICCPSIYENFNAGMLALPHKIPMLLEKPPGTSLAELLELRDTAKSYQTPVMVGLNRNWYSVLRKALVSAGGREAITSVSIDWSEDPQHLMRRGFTSNQIARRVCSNSLHGLSLLTFLAGDIPEPAIMASDLGEPFRWLMALYGTSDTGVWVTFQSSWDSPIRWRMTFSTPGRFYTFSPLERCTVARIGRKDEEIEPDIWDQRFKPGYYVQARNFLQVIKTSEVPAQAELNDVIRAMTLAEKLTQACLTVRKISHQDTALTYG